MDLERKNNLRYSICVALISLLALTRVTDARKGDDVHLTKLIVEKKKSRHNVFSSVLFNLSEKDQGSKFKQNINSSGYQIKDEDEEGSIMRKKETKTAPTDSPKSRDGTNSPVRFSQKKGNTKSPTEGKQHFTKSPGKQPKSAAPFFIPTTSPSKKRLTPVPSASPTAVKPSTGIPTKSTTTLPTSSKTFKPTKSSTPKASANPTRYPTLKPTATKSSTISPSPPTTPTAVAPTRMPATEKSLNPSNYPTKAPISTTQPHGTVTGLPSKAPSLLPTKPKSENPTETPSSSIATAKPSKEPSLLTPIPSASPTTVKPSTGIPTKPTTTLPTLSKTFKPTTNPTRYPTLKPTATKSSNPTKSSTISPSPPTTPTAVSPTRMPAAEKSLNPSNYPTNTPISTTQPHGTVTELPSEEPSLLPTKPKSENPTETPSSSIATAKPSKEPSLMPTRRKNETLSPTFRQAKVPTNKPTFLPTKSEETAHPTSSPAKAPMKTLQPVEMGSGSPSAYSTTPSISIAKTTVPTLTNQDYPSRAPIRTLWSSPTMEISLSIFISDFENVDTSTADEADNLVTKTRFGRGNSAEDIVVGNSENIINLVVSTFATVFCRDTDFTILGPKDDSFYNYCRGGAEVSIPDELNQVEGDAILLTTEELSGERVREDLIDIQDQRYLVVNKNRKEEYLYWTTWTIKYPLIRGLSEWSVGSDISGEFMLQVQRTLDRVANSAISSGEVDSILEGEVENKVIVVSVIGSELETFMKFIDSQDDSQVKDDQIVVEEEHEFWQNIRIAGFALLGGLIFFLALLFSRGRQTRIKKNNNVPRGVHKQRPQTQGGTIRDKLARMFALDDISFASSNASISTISFPSVIQRSNLKPTPAAKSRTRKASESSAHAGQIHGGQRGDGSPGDLIFSLDEESAGGLSEIQKENKSRPSTSGSLSFASAQGGDGHTSSMVDSANSLLNRWKRSSKDLNQDASVQNPDSQHKSPMRIPVEKLEFTGGGGQISIVSFGSNGHSLTNDRQSPGDVSFKSINILPLPGENPRQKGHTSDLGGNSKDVFEWNEELFSLSSGDAPKSVTKFGENINKSLWVDFRNNKWSEPEAASVSTFLEDSSEDRSRNFEEVNWKRVLSVKEGSGKGGVKGKKFEILWDDL